jgi:uracil-DNA glycosylase
MDAALAGVSLEWRALMDLDYLSRAIAPILADETVTPPLRLIFEAFRYGGPADITTVIMGQDPYPTPGEAQGLCFSIPGGVARPESLKRIFECLERAGLCREHPELPPAAQPAAGGDLRPWAVQGVLMLNAALTTRARERGAHAAAWKPFVDDFLRRFCAERAAAGARVHFLLWGDDARAYAAEARRHSHAVHEWTHPSPLADNRQAEAARFRACPHFEEVNAALAAAGRRRVAWDNLAPAFAFTDGSCPLNGRPGARASFAALVTGGQFGAAAIVRGEVRPTEYAFVDEGDPERGLRATRAPATPSNNRGELLGIVYAFLALLRGRAVGRVEVISDSEISVNTLLDWLPARLKKGTERELKNYDLVMIAWRLLGLLRAQAAEVVLTHTRSHQKAPPASAPSRERFIHRGNAMADEHAALALKSGAPDYVVEVLDAPAVLRALATPS